MSQPSEQAIARALLKRHGQTFAQELEIKVERNSPSALFRLLCASLLFSARIRATVAVAAARALADRGWTTPEKMINASWEERAKTLNQAGYARYDERTSTMLAETAHMILEKYAGDLRRLREAAGYQPKQERKLLKQFKGIGDVGADIFFREVQVAWDELFPFADRRALEGAQQLGLPDETETLLQLAGEEDFPRLVAALVRLRLEGDADDVLAEVRQSEE
jgi:endonuclease III